MSFLNKYKFHYHNKQLEVLFKSKDYLDLLSYLEKLSDEKKIFHDLSFKYVNHAIHTLDEDISKKQIVWINSFRNEDKKYILSFIETYLSNFNSLKQKIKTYQEEIDEILLKSEQIDFNTLINHSYFFQWMIINTNNLPYKFISNNLPFFSTKENFNFTKSNITQAYIHVINHPYNIYQSIKKDNNNDPEIARNIFLNLDQRATQQDQNKISFYLFRKGWHTNTQSWTDANVVNSLRGKIISTNELKNNSYEVLSSIILHLIQSGVEIELDYDLIEKFVKNNSYIGDETYEEISTKERKFLDKYVSDIIETYDLQ